MAAVAVSACPVTPIRTNSVSATGSRLPDPDSRPDACSGPVRTAAGGLAVAANASVIGKERKGGSVNSNRGSADRSAASHAS
jgi:hypothetical protein